MPTSEPPITIVWLFSTTILLLNLDFHLGQSQTLPKKKKKKEKRMPAPHDII